MKRFLIIALLGLSFTSCKNTPTEVQNPKEVTTVELQQLAKIDTVTYKVVEKDNTVYVLSTKDNMVVKKVTNDTGFVFGLLIAFVLVLFAMYIVMLLNS
jgi:hypothetical protein